MLQKLAADLGLNFDTAAARPAGEAFQLRPLRIGLWDRYGGSMPSGWTRWLLERFEFPFQLVFAPELDRGGLREKFDVLIFADGAIPGIAGQSENRRRDSSDSGGDQPPSERSASSEPNEQALPELYRGRRGRITTTTTVPQLRKFLERGGTILTIGSSTSLGQHLGLPLANHLVATDPDGKEHPLPREEFYVPASVLRMRVEPAHPLAWGVAEEVDVIYSASPTFRFRSGAESNGLRRVAWFDSKEPLRSGWAWGQEHLEGGIAIAEAEVGKGRLVMFGPQILFRGQPHGTFKFLFNGIVQAAMRE